MQIRRNRLSQYLVVVGRKKTIFQEKTNKTSFGKRLKIKDGLTMQVANGNFFPSEIRILFTV